MKHVAKGGLIALLAAGVLMLLGARDEARADGFDDCIPDGQKCRTNQSCCSGVCVKSTKKSFGTCAACRFPATGQTTCWDSSGTVIPCAGTDQDGDTRKGAPLAYVDNGDGTITDKNTGLVWEKQSMDGSIHDTGNSYTWADAFAQHVGTLNSMSFAGHTDWRVPNIRELHSIVNFQNAPLAVSPAFNTNCMAGCTVLTCSCTSFAGYWSSTTFASEESAAWGVGYDGEVFGYPKSGNALVRAVRGGS